MPLICRMSSRITSLLVSFAIVSAATADDYAWHARRARLRSVRNELRAMAQDDATHRAKVDAAIVTRLIDVAENHCTAEQTARLKALASQIAWLDANSALPLSEKLAKQRNAGIDYRIILGADHFYRSHMKDLNAHIEDYLNSRISENASKPRRVKPDRRRRQALPV